MMQDSLVNAEIRLRFGRMGYQGSISCPMGIEGSSRGDKAEPSSPPSVSVDSSVNIVTRIRAGRTGNPGSISGRYTEFSTVHSAQSA
jgi:hypothetical protein